MGRHRSAHRQWRRRAGFGAGMVVAGMLELTCDDVGGCSSSSSSCRSRDSAATIRELPQKEATGMCWPTY
ncbi:hypothetical protein M758_4G104600 [Ceratodon purpureus]|uniref:Uncharacterized protein n=1 Tax=Ceratodon purpureus TaxID=3225 RepID=A0A8T0IAM8_CERPU|nr:hypothetical protein KC19_4G106200 [Ceratodon purpureus]KAG0618960.1 hypothetical protein M758_4G104600 [Ceratodon purpureus]